MKCLDCKHVDIERSPRHTGVGFGKCAFDGLGEYQNFDIERKCSKYKEAPKEVIFNRKQWRENSQ